MANFEDIIQGTLSTIDAGFRQAEADLREVVGEVSSSLKRATSERFVLAVVPAGDEVDGKVHSLHLIDSERSKKYEIEHLLVTRKGYPRLGR